MNYKKLISFFFYAYSSMYNQNRPTNIIIAGIDIKVILEANTMLFNGISKPPF